MSNALAIAGVTAVLRDRLNDGLVNHNVTGVLGNTVTVSVEPPDRVMAADGSEASQINLFLYQVTPNSGWRNEGLPSHSAGGQHRLSNPPLALDLHFLLSAYSAADLHAEILLGYAMQLMHQFPVITREMIRTALNPSPDVGVDLPPALRALAECGLADQVELLRITPVFMNSEEMSKLWSATQFNLRPSAVYQVSVVLIEAQEPIRSPLPVLTRGAVNAVTGRERGVVATPDLQPSLPTIDAVVPEGNQPVLQLDQPVTLQGHHLHGTARQVRLRNERFGIDEWLNATGTSATDTITFTVPAARAADFPAGMYDITAQLIMPGESDTRESNRLACTLAPNITNLPQIVARDGDGDATITINFTPELRGGQTVSLLLGQDEIAPITIAAPTASLNFVVEDAEASSSLTRLRIDGIDSPITDRSVEPPVFFNQRVTIT
jgi:Pvc16 N-terminal domain